MRIILRKEVPSDHQAVAALIQQAFKEEAMSDHTEHLLVERLRASDDFIPELSIVATDGEQVLGYILLSRIWIDNGNRKFESLALAPVAVLPSFQGKGIGGQLIEYAHEKARDLGFTSVVLLGHENYYPRFGYQPASSFGIQLPFEVPEANCMAIALVSKGLDGANGMVVYPETFGV